MQCAKYWFRFSYMQTNMAAKRTRMAARLPPTPKTFKDVRRLAYSDLIRLCKDVDIKTAGIGRDSLEILLCDSTGISTTGSNKLGREIKKPRLQDHLLDEREVREFEELTPAKVQALDNWTKSLTKIPDIDIGIVKKYLLASDNPEFTKGELKKYKLSRAYEHLNSKHIHSVMFNPLETSKTFCIVKAKCLPSQSTENKKVKCLHVILDKCTGEPYGAFCVCTVGRGQACSHVGALLFLLCELVANGTANLPDDKSCTDVLCPWSEPKGSHVQPTLAENISIGGRSDSKPTVGNYVPQVAPKLTCAENYDRVLKLLYDIRNANKPSAMPTIVNIIDLDRFRPCQVPTKPQVRCSLPDRCWDFDIPFSMEMNVSTYPLPVCPFVQSIKNINFEEDKEHFMCQLKLTDEEKTRVEMLTREQSKSEEWFEQRKGSITGSKAYRVLSFMENGNSNPHLIVKDIMQYDTDKNLSKNIPALAWGLKHETTALLAYVKDLKKCHDNVILNRPGLVVHPECAYLRASPDAIISCKCHGQKIVEVKCPFKHRNDNIDEVINKKGLEYVDNINGHKVLKRRQCRGYYEQITLQQAVTNIKNAEMLIWTKKGYSLINVDFDVDFWDECLFPALKEFFIKYVVAEILTESVND